MSTATKPHFQAIRKNIIDLPAYTPIEPYDVLSQKLGRPPEEIIKLDANENPYGPSPRVAEAIARCQYLHVYPDPESRALRSALSEKLAFPEAHLMAGAGADELIDMIMRTLLEPGELVANCPPTFGMYTFDTLVNDGAVVNIPRRSDFSVDLEGLKTIVRTQKPKILFLASPNNPDGSRLTTQEINTILDFPLLVVLDEAYIEFTSSQPLASDQSMLSRVLLHDNLIVLRTFSKWAGLAGLRIGYGGFPGWIMPSLWKAKQPYNVNVAASIAALASLSDLETLQSRINQLQEEKLHLFQELQKCPLLDPIPSNANFILCKVNHLLGSQLQSRLAQDYGILVRYFDKPGLYNHIRISVGTAADTLSLTQALTDLADKI